MANITVKDELKEKLKRLAKFRGVTIPDLLLQFLESIEDVEADEIGLFNET